MPHFDTGNTGFMLIAASLVMLMTPGLAFFYGGLVGRKNVLTIMIQSFLSLAVVDAIWFAFGYSLCFSGGQGAVIGDLHMAFLNGMDLNTAFGDGQIPMFAFVVYQMMFAIITPALITGAFANRVRFSAYFIFLVVWLILVYFPLVHMIWGGGLLAQWGVRDFAGGIVVHASAGFAALASVFFIGPRQVKDRGPHSIPLVALGTGLLWFGWYGFNAGSELRVDQITVTAFLNTDLAASFAAVTWLILAWIFEKKPKFLGLLTGSIAGLATITPAAGYVTPGAAIIIGILSGLVCYLAITLKNRLHWDDALDVWGVHGVGGVLGILSLGVFGSLAVNASGFDGALRGGWAFLGRQATAGFGAAVYSFLIAFAALWVINKITRVHVAEGEEEVGLDTAELGEHAYL
ncbi:MAG: ammonium transporter [Spirochaetia bacterium]